MLGALAIVIAILIVLNAQDRKDRSAAPPTVTETPSSTGTSDAGRRAGAIVDRDDRPYVGNHDRLRPTRRRPSVRCPCQN